MSRSIGEAEIREIAVAASADPRSVRKVLDGGRVRGMADGRIRRALAKRGLEPAARPTAATDAEPQP